MKLDKESQAEIWKKEALARIFSSDDGKTLMSYLVDKIMDLQSVMNIEGKDAVEIATKVSAVRAAVEILTEVMNELRGSQTFLDSFNSKREGNKEEIIRTEE